MTPRGYFADSRAARYSITFAVPLLVLYEVSAALLNESAVSGVRNGADVLLKTAFVMLGGRTGLHVFALVLFLWGLVLVLKDFRAHPGEIRLKYFAFMLGESFLLAAVFGSVAVRLTALLLSGPLATIQEVGAAGAGGPGGLQTMPLQAQLVVSLGAGLYEELLFRVLLVSAFLGLAKKLGLSKSIGVVVAVIGSALIFSAFHYVGPYGDVLTLPSFMFRTIAGLLLSGIYVARGFGIVAWTHALYDVGYALMW
jgi:Type II CAAX prenyl endopeptidase Rce1-like